jgi:hypothetical protein
MNEMKALIGMQPLRERKTLEKHRNDLKQLEGDLRVGESPLLLCENSSADSSPCEDGPGSKTYVSKKLSVSEVKKLIVCTGQYYVQVVEATKTEKNEKYRIFRSEGSRRSGPGRGASSS